MTSGGAGGMFQTLAVQPAAKGRDKYNPPGQIPRKTWLFNFDDKDLLLLDRDLLLLGTCGWHSVFNQFRSVF